MPSYSLADIAKHIQATVVGDDSISVSALAPIDEAQPGDLTFLLGGKYRTLLPNTKASAVILTQADSAQSPAAALVVDNPELAFATVAKMFQKRQAPPIGIHPTAVIAESAVVAKTASIDAYCVIGERVSIGENTVLGSSVHVGHEVVIGQDCQLHASVTIYDGVSIANRVIVHSGVVIGADGFGLTRTKTGWQEIPQIGRVLIHDDVSIGANSCIDRGALSDTVIHRGVKIDNLVQIAHNVTVGADTVIAGCTGIAGSTTIGKNCMIAGAVNISGHLKICDGVVLTGTAMVTSSITEPGVYSSGTGLYLNSKWRKMAVRLRQLDQFMRKKKR